MNLQQAIDQRKQNTVNQFYTNLMQYAMHSSPQFDMSGKNPQYIGGGSKMPSKTQLWNQYVQIKGGRLAPQDLAEFEQYYQSALSAHQSNQIKGLQQLEMKGYSPKKIQSMVKDSPELYQNLMDMVTNFEAMGDEQGTAAGATIRDFLPSTDKGFISDEMGMGKQLALLGGAGAGYGAYKYATGIDPASRKESRKAFVKEGKEWKTNVKDMDKKLIDKQKIISDRKEIITRKSNLLKIEKGKSLLKRNDLKIKNMTKELTSMNKELTSIERDYSKLVNKSERLGRKSPTYNPAQSRYQNFKKNYPKAVKGVGGAGGLLGMILAKPVGETIGGEAGGRIAEGGVGAAIAGSGVKRFVTGMAARRAVAGAGNLNPYVQAGLLALDLGIGGSMLYQALKGE